MRWYLVLLSTLVALTAAAALIAFLRVQDVQHHQNDALHSIICHGENVARTTRFYSPVQRRRAIKFYNQSLAVAHLAPCPNP